MGFPQGFVWGTAASSYQNEGAVAEGGRTPSIWDMMSRWEGKIRGGGTGDVTCDQYHRYAQDARLMRELGLQAYRTSIAWSRVVPDGAGTVNEQGLAYYDRLVDALLENGVEPWMELFHWDDPYWFFLRGAWLNPASPDWFAEYAAAVVERLSDRVSHWMTLNEPQVFVGSGYRSGTNAPGLRLDYPEVLLIAHRVLLAHGKTVQVIRARAKTPPQVCIAPVGFVGVPASDSPADIEAARAYMFTLTEKRFMNTWFSDPLFLGRYPDDGFALFGKQMPRFPASDMDVIFQPLDYYSFNCYSGPAVRAAPDGGYELVPPLDGAPLTTMDWVVTPDVLYWGPKFFYERYRKPIVVSENGVAICDWVHLDGLVHDPQRIDFLTRYLRAYKRAIGDGVDARGYFIWTLLDNFELEQGFKQRFGIVFVDYTTQQRIPKDSALWYRDVIATNGALL